VRFNLLRDRVEIGPFARFQFGMDEFTIDTNFERTATGRNQLYTIDSRRVANFGRQTDGARFVVSGRAIFDRNIGLHIRAPSVSPYQAVEAGASRPH
jgi:hypothetical protein